MDLKKGSKNDWKCMLLGKLEKYVKIEEDVGVEVFTGSSPFEVYRSIAGPKTCRKKSRTCPKRYKSHPKLPWDF